MEYSRVDEELYLMAYAYAMRNANESWMLDLHSPAGKMGVQDGLADFHRMTVEQIVERLEEVDAELAALKEKHEEEN
jgi:succinylglutamate desuccinylase